MNRLCALTNALADVPVIIYHFYRFGRSVRSLVNELKEIIRHNVFASVVAKQIVIIPTAGVRPFSVFTR